MSFYCKKHIVALFLTLVASIGTMFAWDFERVQIDDLYYNLDSVERRAEVTYQTVQEEYLSTPANYVGLTTATIPSSIEYLGKTYSVSGIGHCAFKNSASLTTVVIPNSVTYIGGRAFKNCTSLANITIPNNVQYINIEAFMNCPSLPVVDNIRYADTYLVEAVDKSLSTYTIRAGTRWIGSMAFVGCTNLTSITIPNGVEEIGYYSFTGCSSLPTFFIPSSVISIDFRAFDDCDKMTSINVDANNPNYCSIDGVVFSKDKTILFRCPCGRKGAYTIPSTVITIGSDAFSGCFGLTQITIPNSVASIGGGAFYDCTGLTSITVPSSVTYIGGYAFLDCINLTSVMVEAATPPSLDGENVFMNTNNCPIYVPCGTQNAYKTAWTTYAYRIHSYSLETTDSIENITICHGDSYTWHGVTYDYSTTQTEILVSSVGCDSVCTLNLTVLPTLTGDAYASFCEGTTYTWENHFLPDGITPMTFTQGGIYRDTIAGYFGCDSICVLHLSTSSLPKMTVRPDTCISPGALVRMWATGVDFLRWTPEDALIKTSDNQIYAQPTQTTTYTVVGYNLSNNNVVYNGDFEKGNVGFTTNLLYFQPYTSPGGWGDYTVTDNIKGFWPLSYTPSVKAYGGSGNMMVVDGQTTPNSIVWQQQVTVNPNTYYAFSAQVMSCWESNLEGQYALLQFSVNGQQLGPIFHSPKQVYEWDKYYEIWYSGNNTTATLRILNQNNNGFGNDFAIDEIRFDALGNSCEDTQQVTIYVGSTDSVETATICNGDTYSWHGRDFTSSTTVSETIKNAEGCDSICTLHLTVLPPITGDTTAIITEGESFSWYGDSYSIAGDYVHTLTSSINGCDSVVTLHLIVNPWDFDIQTHAQCADDPFVEFDVVESHIAFDKLQFVFSPKAIEQHFRDTTVTYSQSQILIPNNARAGVYEVAISPISNNQIKQTRNFQFSLLYPSSVLDQHWDDFIGVLTHDYNGGYDFVGFQWYKDGTPINGENHSYIYQPLEMGAAYSAMLEEQDGTKLMTCEIIASTQMDISLYPTLVQSKQMICLHSSKDITIWVYDNLGKLIYSHSFTSGDHQFEAPQTSGVYIINVQQNELNGKMESKKLLVK